MYQYIKNNDRCQDKFGSFSRPFFSCKISLLLVWFTYIEMVIKLFCYHLLMNMAGELAKAYEPSSHEDGIYKKWEESGKCNPDNLAGEPYSIMMPPPNVTGVLHLGHALENTLMDVMTRYQRMKGRKVLLLPGTDHAAVATQAKVEKLLVERGIKNPRQELGREKLLEKIREYAENSKATILSQIKKMGTSCDWSRLAYTFDEARNRAVNEVFIRMFNDGLIYRGYRVVNWSVKGQSTCSDDELIYVERPAKLYTFKYGKDFPIAIATTRPETKLGDTAVAVNPGDDRYRKYIGQVFAVDVGAAEPLEIKIIADEAVDPNFGTGALGVTPAHSATDFEIYEKQKAKGEPIGLVQVIGQDGRMTAAAGAAHEGLTAEEARVKFVSWLEENDLMTKPAEEINQNVGTSDRFGDVVEALPSMQWFVAVNKKVPGKDKTLKELMREAVTTGHNGDPKQKIAITPERFQKVYLNWIENLRDWCISRQIWWGHRIPVWYDKKLNETRDTYRGSENVIRVGRKPLEEEAVGGEGWVQDEDTLDTWFSSGLWTFSTLGWPGEPNDLKTFHPTNWMQMGYEILFFWMARMILMTSYALDQIPFRDVYIHGMLRDELGKKFSKSAGNNVDPLEVIKEYGTDALRFSLIAGIAPGNDSRFYEEKVTGARNLVNKLWNVSRFILSNFEIRQDYEIKINDLTEADNWIIFKFQNLVREVTDDLESFNFSPAGEKLREFTWDYLADWYLEASKFEKTENKKNILSHILINLLKLWHPFIPFVTEAIWQEAIGGQLLMIETWPKGSIVEMKSNFETVKEVIAVVRNARSEHKIEPAKKIKAVIYAGEKKELIESQAHLVKGLRTGIEELEIKERGDKLGNAIYLTVDGVEIYLLGAMDEAKERARLEKEIARLEALIAANEQKLANEEFVAKAPKTVVNSERLKLQSLRDEAAKLKNQLNNI